MRREIKETYLHTDVSNTIYETKQEYVPDSVVFILLDDNGANIRAISVKEIGLNYVEIKEQLPLNCKVSVKYDILVTEVSEVNILETVRQLEKRLTEQEKVINILTQALDERVNKHTFSLWIQAVEKVIGQKVIANSLIGIQSHQL